MKPASPVQAVADSLAHAAYAALPGLTREEPDLVAVRAAREAAAARGVRLVHLSEVPRRQATRRPRLDQCVVEAMFLQTWGSTALGFGGLGGAAMTDAYTVVVRGPGGERAVYWAGRFAYLVPARGADETSHRFAQDVAAQHTLARTEARQAYGATF